jgi:hypothetical protein
MNKKLPSQLDSESLLAALDQSDTTDINQWDNDIPLFISKYKLDAGPHRVPSITLYKVYLLFSKEPLTRKRFTDQCSLFIPFVGQAFRLNIEVKTLIKYLYTDKIGRTQRATTNVNLKTHVDKFIHKVQLEKGNSPVEADVLFEIYRLYCIDNKISNRLSKSTFTTIFKLYFKFKRIGSSRIAWFFVNKEIIDRLLTKDDIERVKRNKRSRSDRKKEKKP